MFKKIFNIKTSSNNKRKYIRIPTILPVEFFITDANNKKITPWLQGFTCDIGKGGICLSVNDLWWGFWKKARERNCQFFLKINFPFKRKPIFLKTKANWFNKKDLGDFKQYVIGLEFLEKNSKEEYSLFRYAAVKKSIPFLVIGFIAVLAIFAFSLNKKANILIQKNRKLVNSYVGMISEESQLKEILEGGEKDSLFLKGRRDEVEIRITMLSSMISEQKEKYNDLPVTEPPKEIKDQALKMKGEITLLELELATLKRENDFLKMKQERKKESKQRIKDEMDNLEKERLTFSSKIIEGMYCWIKNRQDLLRGLILSYEGDKNLEEVCFTYDQALGAIIFLTQGDDDRAKKVLDFYLNKIENRQDIYNAYITNGDVFEYVVHSGPCAWIGIAALDYVKQTRDKKYLKIARKVSNFLFLMMDSEGGIRGGEKDLWYSTEHNLDAFAFFDLFYRLTGKKKYNQAALKIKKWIERYSYTSYGPPVKRGKGDPTIATDTYSWSVTALGPELLYSLNMNPEVILKFGVKNCEVTTDFKRKQGNIELTGFDFAKAKNMSRGGIISSEWTSQMILAFEIMANYFQDKDHIKSQEYMEEAVFYFSELQKMLITSLSKSGKEDPCLPYASVPSADTGHGWRTPKGNTTGSLAATAYFLLAYYGYNPLKAQFVDFSLKKYYTQELKRFTEISVGSKEVK